MVDLLIHDPAGDHNPYDAVPWSRDPLVPTTQDAITVGVRTTTNFESVVIELNSADDTSTALLKNDSGTWTGTIDPLDGDARYRFLGSLPDTERDEVTEWFDLPVARWNAVRFTSLATIGTSIEASGNDALLRINTKQRGVLDWVIANGSNDGPPGETCTSGGWTAVLVDGSLALSSELGTITLAVEGCRIGDQINAWRLVWDLDNEELLFGTGERFDSLNQRGKAPDIRVYEQYKQQGGRTYFPLPWLWSTRGYGLAIDGKSRISYDLGVTAQDRASATIPTQSGASGRWYFGKPKALVQAYVHDTGRPSPLPVWGYGPWMSGNEWNTDRRVREVVERSVAEGIPASVIVIEAWADEVTFYLFNGATHDVVDGDTAVAADSMRYGTEWPDPAGLVDWLHEQGVRVLLWQIPLLKDVEGHAQHDADLRFVGEAGLAVGTTDGGVYRNRGWWFPNSRAIDFTNPEARRWWFNKRAYLLDEIGIDGFKTDGGEHLWGSDVSTFAGETGDEAANAYPTHYLSSYHAFLREHGHDKPLTFSRAGFTGSQAFPAHWAGDEDSTWVAFRASLVAGLSAAASGIAFWGWDLAGFSKELPTADLYKRSTAMAAFCPIMQYHSEHNEHRQPLADRTPWNVADHTGDATVTDVYRFYANLRMNLVPYLLSLGDEAVTHGTPIMRPLVLEFPHDEEAVGIEDQFLLGADILVAPVLTPEPTERNVYLPDAEWFDLWTGAPMDAGWSVVPATSDLIPVFVRAGACIPLWMPDTVELGAEVGLPSSESGHLVLMMFPGTGKRSVVEPLGGGSISAQLSLENQMLTVATDGVPAGTSLWIRGCAAGETPAVDHHQQLDAGASVVTVRVSFDAS